MARPLRQTLLLRAACLLFFLSAAGGYSQNAHSAVKPGSLRNEPAAKATGAFATATANVPPTVRLINPSEADEFYAPALLSLVAEASDEDGAVNRVLFLLNDLPAAAAYAPPYTAILTAPTNGVYRLRAIAVDDQGYSVSTPEISVTVTYREPVARAAIIQAESTEDVDVLQSLLAEAQLAADVFDRSQLLAENFEGYAVVICRATAAWTQSVTSQEINLFQRLQSLAVPLYFIGPNLLTTATSLDPSIRSQWNKTLRLQLDSHPGDSSLIAAGDSSHPVVNGPRGLLGNFQAPTPSAGSSVVSTNDVVIARAGNSDLVAAYENPDSGARTVTQLLLLLDPEHPEGQSQRSKLFQNAVAWLTGAAPATFPVDLLVYAFPSANPSVTGSEVKYTFVAQKNGGEAYASDVIIAAVLPPGVRVVSSSPNTLVRSNLVTCFLGLLPFYGATGAGAVTVVTEQGGPLVTRLKVTSANREITPDNNEYVMPLTGVTPPVMGLLRMPDGGATVRLTGTSGQSYRIESSSDLVDWVTEFSGTVPLGLDWLGTIEFVESPDPESTPRFFRGLWGN